METKKTGKWVYRVLLSLAAIATLSLSGCKIVIERIVIESSLLSQGKKLVTPNGAVEGYIHRIEIPPFPLDSDDSTSNYVLDLESENIIYTTSEGMMLFQILSGGELISESRFPYYRTDNQLIATDPDAIDAWLLNFSGFAGLMGKIIVDDLRSIPATSETATASLTVTASRGGLPLATGSDAWIIDSDRNSCQRDALCWKLP